MNGPYASGDAVRGSRTIPHWLHFDADGDLGALDIALGRFLHGLDPQAPELALRLACLCSARLGQGHPGLDLRTLQSGAPAGRPGWLVGTLQDSLQALGQARFVGDGQGGEPLVLDGAHLYLARYWRAAQRIRASIQARLTDIAPVSSEIPRVRALFDAVFGPVDPHAEPDWQRLACAAALLSRFSIITGGPGTGKTTTVVRLLILLLALDEARASGQRLRIRLAAPTGKAAARLTESILGVLAQGRDWPQWLAQHEWIPKKAYTLHHVLGVQADHPRPRHHAGNPLDLDVLVVDEASMLDMALMDAMLGALPKTARLVLLGDKDQLASVEAGAILGELCQRAEQGHYRPEHAERLRSLCGQAPGPGYLDAHGTPLDQAIVMLRRSHRFSADSGIGRLARVVHDADLPALHGLMATALADLRWVLPKAGDGRLSGRPADAAGQDGLQAAGVLADHGYPALFAQVNNAPGAGASAADYTAWAAEVLRQQSQFQVLCAVRQGPWGVEGVNARLEAQLRRQGHIPAVAGPWYAGRPVLVLRNQPALGLANGDMGVALPFADPAQPGRARIRVAFAGSQPGEVRWISPARLVDVETAFALTVHKSQGSEFTRVVLVLPAQPGPILTRELLYTGLTRARQHLSIVSPGGVGVIEHAMRNPVRREGGLLIG